MLVPRILLVEDDKDHLSLFTMILETGGYSVDSFSDPAAALSKFKPKSYDLSVLDYRMPDLDGFELYKRIREMEEETKALLLTATHEQIIDDNAKYLDQRLLKVIRKPVNNEDLLKEVNSILN
jgi:DNA-binding response OmpR family regulator